MTTSILDRLGFGSSTRATAERNALDIARSNKKIDRKQLKFDLFTHVSYMASLATAKASRGLMFEKAAELELASTPYFIEINTLVHRLKYDYSEACRAVADRTKVYEVSALLMRMSGSLASGEDEAEFLTREAAVMAELYQAEYERDIESLRKWTDAYAALIVSAGLIVVISMISMMIWSLPPAMILMTGFATVTVIGVGAFILRATAPTEGFTRKSGLSASMQLQAKRLMLVFGLAGAVLGSVLVLVVGLGPGLIVAGLGLLPGGFIMSRDRRRLSRIDTDVATSTRLLGGVTDAIGTTVNDALSKVDRRSMGAMEPYFKRLEVRVRAGISPDLCWKRLTIECGSNLVDRTVDIFWDALTIGGSPLETGKNAAFFASTIVLLREKRRLVASTFGFLVLPLHASMVGLLVFILNVMRLFATQLTDVDAPDPTTSGAPLPDIANVSGFNTFAGVNFEFLGIMVVAVILSLTVANAVAPWSVNGGHRMSGAFGLGLMMLISGLMLTVIPPMADGVFNTITAPAS